MEVIVVDGCSTDGTAELVKAFRDERIKLIQQKEREGVTEAVKAGVLQSEGEIIVMTDAEASIEPNALRLLVDDFTNTEVGAVTGTEVVVNPSKNIFTRMESTYRKFFNMSCIAESNAYSTSHFRGEFVGLRKELFPMTVNSRKGILDVEIALGVIQKGHRAICDERIKFFVSATSTLEDINRQKIQRATLIQETIIRNIDFLFKPKFKTFGLVVFPCNFIMYFISPIIFLTLLGLYPLLVINCILHSQVLTLIAVMPALFIIFSKKYRIFILAFLHAQYSLTVGMFRIALLGRPDFLSQVKSTRKGFVSPTKIPPVEQIQIEKMEKKRNS